ncbi:MAG: hypothetical protein HS115_00535 [Spirochaetales bacterium]|nr:hypothetical protein [Spirochaetales bacterium]
MKRFLILPLLLFLLSGCWNEPALETSEITLDREAAQDLPSYLIPSGARVLINGSYNSGSFLAFPESATIFASEKSREELIAFFMAAFKKERWNIIQSMDRPGESLLMAESDYRKLITVLVRDGESRTIKIYTRSSADN